MTTKLHIGNMPRTSTNDEIEGLFRPFGLVSSVTFAKDPASGAIWMPSRRSIDLTSANTVAVRLE
jgi:RNA recognition motif-containing protein